jgi:F-type H+-transporting ATPase subunit a
MMIFVALDPKASAIGPFDSITNSTVFAMVVVAAIVAFVQLSLRTVHLIPAGAQNFLEWLVESVYGLLEGIVGHHMIRKVFPLLCSLFIFIVASNWSGLLPGVGTIGWGVHTENGFHIVDSLFRPTNADLNATLAIALLFMGIWLFWTLREVGAGGFIKHMFAPKGLMSVKGKPLWLMGLIVLLNLFLVGVFLMVGVIEVISISSRAISLALRLFGNVFAGENLLHEMGAVSSHPVLATLISLPFYGLEILVGLLQGLVFMLLCAVYIQLSCTHEEGHEDH